MIIVISGYYHITVGCFFRGLQILQIEQIRQFMETIFTKQHLWCTPLNTTCICFRPQLHTTGEMAEEHVESFPPCKGFMYTKIYGIQKLARSFYADRNLGTFAISSQLLLVAFQYYRKVSELETMRIEDFCSTDSCL